MKKLFDIGTNEKQKPDAIDNKYGEWCDKNMEAQNITGLNVKEKIALKICICTNSSEITQRLEVLQGNKTQGSKEVMRNKYFT